MALLCLITHLTVPEVNMAGLYNFGQTILGVLGEQDKLNAQKEQAVQENAYRQQQLQQQGAYQNANLDIQREQNKNAELHWRNMNRNQKSELVVKNYTPSKSLPPDVYERLKGFGVSSQSVNSILGDNVVPDDDSYIPNSAIKADMDNQELLYKQGKEAADQTLQAGQLKVAQDNAVTAKGNLAVNQSELALKRKEKSMPQGESQSVIAGRNKSIENYDKVVEKYATDDVTPQIRESIRRAGSTVLLQHGLPTDYLKRAYNAVRGDWYKVEQVINHQLESGSITESQASIAKKLIRDYSK